MIRDEAAPDSTRLELRPFDPARDFQGAADLIAAVNTYDKGQDWFPTVGNLLIEWAPSPAFDPARDLIVVEGDGQLLAGGKVDWGERAGKVIHHCTIWVRPEVRRRGLGRRMLAWLEARARESLAEGAGGPAHLPHFLGGGTDVANAASVAFAQRAGYEPIRYGFQMRRPLDLAIPDVLVPDGIEIRPVLPEHHRAIWDADVEAFRDHFEPREHEEAEYVRFMSDPDLDPSIWQVAWDGAEVVGSVINGIFPHENVLMGEELGWLEHVSVRRPWRGRGVAKALIARSLTVLRDRGMRTGVLGVDADNPTGALQLYEQLGFRPHRRWATVRKPL
ncbi:MAG: GNAT family N-acetyltransferase [Chloroflexota bacterium]